MQAIWLFDGVCVLCSRAVQLTLKYEKAATIRFVAIQSDEGKALAVKHGIDPNNPDSFLFIENGIAHTKSGGVIALARHLKGAAFLAFAARIVPRTIRDWMYDRVAQNRYRWFGVRQECMMPTPDMKARFLP